MKTFFSIIKTILPNKQCCAADPVPFYRLRLRSRKAGLEALILYREYIVVVDPTQLPC